MRRRMADNPLEDEKLNQKDNPKLSDHKSSGVNSKLKSQNYPFSRK